MSVPDKVIHAREGVILANLAYTNEFVSHLFRATYSQGGIREGKHYVFYVTSQSFLSRTLDDSHRLLISAQLLAHAIDLIEPPRAKVGLAEKGGADSATHEFAAAHQAVHGDRIVDRFKCDENLQPNTNSTKHSGPKNKRQ